MVLKPNCESICPGYKHVQAFSNDEDYYDSSEDEVSYITLDLGDVEPQLVPNSTAYRLIGLDTPTPYLQLHGTIMKGRHDFLLGTELIFTDDKENHDWNNRSLIHVANTDQRIAFQEVTLTPKNPNPKEKISPNPDLSEQDQQQQQDPLPSAAAAAARITTTTHDFQPPPKPDAVVEIDKLTGLTGPPTRAPRKKKAEKSSGTGGSSEGQTTTNKSGRKKATKSSKGKGKEKATEESNMPMDEGGIGDDDLDDIYMD